MTADDSAREVVMIDYRLFPIVMFAHLLGATLLVASSLYSPLVRQRVRDAPTAGDLRRWLGFAHDLQRANPFAALVVLATGIYLGSVVWWRTGWFWVSLVAFVANSVLALAVLEPHAAKVGRAIADTPPSSPVGNVVDELRRARRLDLASNVMLGGDLALLYLMVRKPSTEVAIGILLAIQLGCVLFGELRRWTATRRGRPGESHPVATPSAPGLH